MKKIIALLLALVMLFGLTACSFPASGGDKCDGDHVDADEDGICDNCKEDVSSSKDPQTPDGEDKDAYLAPTISDAIMAQIEAAGSLKLDFDLDLEIYSRYFYADGYYDDKTEEYVESWIEGEDLTKGVINVSLVLSKTEEGFNAFISIKSTDTSEEELDIEEESLYLIDGVAYSSDSYIGGFAETPLPSFEALMGGDLNAIPAVLVDAIDQLIEGIEIPEEDAEALKSSVGVIITGIFDINDLNGSVNMDYKPYIDEFYAYVESLDPDTKTMESLVDDILHLVDGDLNFANLIGELERIAKLTVKDGLAELDSWLTENYETTVQGIYDTVVADARVEQLVRTYMGMLGVPEGEDPIDEEDIQAFLDELRAIKVEEFIKQYYEDLEAITIYDALMPIIAMLGRSESAPEEPDYNGGTDYPIETMGDEAEAEEEEYPPVNTLFGVIKDFFAMTVSEASEEYGIPDFITEIKSSINGVKINALSYSASIAFADNFAISELEFGAKVDIETSTPAYHDETKNEVSKNKFDLSVKLYAISNDTIEIALPEDAKTVFAIWNFDDVTKDALDAYVLDLYYPDELEDGTFVITGTIWTDENYYDIAMPMPTERQDVYTFDYSYYPEDSFDIATGKVFVIFDYEAYTYTIEFSAQAK